MEWVTYDMVGAIHVCYIVVRKSLKKSAVIYTVVRAGTTQYLKQSIISNPKSLLDIQKSYLQARLHFITEHVLRIWERNLKLSQYLPLKNSFDTIN